MQYDEPGFFKSSFLEMKLKEIKDMWKKKEENYIINFCSDIFSDMIKFLLMPPRKMFFFSE